MGQILLRDLGFEMESKSDNQKVVDEYVKKRITAKYPTVHITPNEDEDRMQSSRRSNQHILLINQKDNEQKQEETSSPEPQREAKFREDVPVRKVNKPATQLEQIEDRVERDTLEDGDNPMSGRENPSHNRYPSQNSVSNRSNKDAPSKKNADSGFYDKPANGKNINTPAQKGKSDRSDQNPKSLTKKKSQNMFDGIEQVNFKSPAGQDPPSGTGNRSRKLKGFENKFFKPDRGRSPSPMNDEYENNVFDDEEDHGYHDEDA